MSSEYKTVIHISSRVEKPRQRTGSDPLAHSAATRLRRDSSPSSSKHSTPTEHIEIGQPCLKCGHKCPGYMQHIWRKQCLHCGCGRSSHTIETEPSSIIPLIGGLTLGDDSSKLTRADVDRLRKYAWYPPGLGHGMVERYMESLPKECVPALGTEGERYRRTQCFQQLPIYDFSLEACHKMSEREAKRHAKITTRRRDEGFGVGIVKLLSSEQKKICTECLLGISMGSVYISSERAGQDKRWHPTCFRCNTCHELLVDLIHYHSPKHEGFYCGRHHLELLVPRCAGCDEMILATHFTEAAGQNWHKEHFCCHECDDQLVGKSSTTHEGKILCNRCFGKYASNCHRCKKAIGIDQKKLSVKGKHYHRECFVCKRCREDLVGERYFIIDDDIICSDCTKPIGQCQGCKEGIRPSVSYLKHGDRCWHADCFKCSACRAWLVDGQFHEMASSVMCNACYVEKMSPKCNTCSQPIKEKGVTFSLKSYHLDCFVCTSCKEPLVGQNGKVKESNGEPYCQSCVDKSYKRCYKCMGAVTTRHTVYNGHTFHLQCFQCSKCGRSIGGAEFFEGKIGEILCSRCAE